MSFTAQQTVDELELTFSGRLGVQDAGPLWESLQEVLLDDTAIRLNAADLDEMDTSIVQILCRLSATPGKLRIAALSEGFVLSLKQRGLANLFIDPPTMEPRTPQAAPNASATPTVFEEEIPC